MVRTAIYVAFACLLAAPAGAQPGSQESIDPSVTDSRLSDVSISAADLAPTGAEWSLQQNGGTRDSLKNGVLTGLLVGGIVGAVWTATCGHPECGPLFGLGLGLGAAIGTGIDALVSRQPGVRVASERTARPIPFASGRRMAFGVRKSW